ncbi:uncharacterized protein SPAPADRAFT_138327 [Spathaspora passalidarum NRRL Y-27907]|uniref:Autophagy-related protein 101 n=1 Tax=Spathaspora passalidarum (strain NRRL Y-27907 / 11-Y1) TaxID=619300 RepID=G3APU3_SPAPN|nr:uncharacterized protein SPAPADRAFT_138327 [Spathaspora passalidarum NRRL Y-27907]EGW32264.1 hypothetical protein SPAPADRAFT_138327 [Spathaspora passalidarum NRRL Y-27907]
MEFVLDLIAERSVIRESLKGVWIMWTVFFNRLFGPITPATNEFLNITYPIAVNLPDLDSLIDERINQLVKSNFDRRLPSKGVVNIQFLDKDGHIKKKTGWFGGKVDTQTSDNLKAWESWIINVECLPIDERPTETSSPQTDQPPATHPRDNNYSTNMVKSIKSFELNLIKIIDSVDRHKQHIPPITTLESSPFPYKISVLEAETVTATGSEASSSSVRTEQIDESWGDYIKKML